MSRAKCCLLASTVDRAAGSAASFRSLSTSAFCSADAKQGADNALPRQAAFLKTVDSLLTAEKGSRHAFNGTVATVFGARGMIGAGVVAKLCRRGTQIIVPYHGEPYSYRRIKPNADLGQMYFTPFHLKDEASILRTCSTLGLTQSNEPKWVDCIVSHIRPTMHSKSLTHTDVVVNCIGRSYETRNFKFADVNVDGARRVARLARQSGVKRLIWLSHVSAREQPDKGFLPGGSRFLKTKWLGERAVLEEFPDATILRCSDILGERDQFAGDILSPVRMQGLCIPIYNKGQGVLKCPIYCEDVMAGILRCIELPDTRGQIIEAHGDHYFVFSELLQYMVELSIPTGTGRLVNLINVQTPVISIKFVMANVLPIGTKHYQMLTLDKLEREAVSDRVEGYRNLRDLGLTLTPILQMMPYIANNFELYSHGNVPASYHRPELRVPEAIPIQLGREYLAQPSSRLFA